MPPVIYSNFTAGNIPLRWWGFQGIALQIKNETAFWSKDNPLVPNRQATRQIHTRRYIRQLCRKGKPPLLIRSPNFTFDGYKAGFVFKTIGTLEIMWLINTLQCLIFPIIKSSIRANPHPFTAILQHKQDIVRLELSTFRIKDFRNKLAFSILYTPTALPPSP